MTSRRRNSNQAYEPIVQVRDHDVLCGRGVNISQHPGNERFRSLINTRHDASYCTSFSTSEKKFLANEVIAHIRSLDPPGRFLKRAGRSQGSRGLEGPWEELTHKDCVKKTCQALRDCNRNDREGYGASIKVPEDVRRREHARRNSGLSLKQHAATQVARMTPPPPQTYRKKTPSPVDSQERPTAGYSTGKTAATACPNNQRAEDPVEQIPTSQNIHSHAPSFVATAEAPLSADIFGAVDATPTGTPHVTAVPVTNTPPTVPISHPYLHQQFPRSEYTALHEGNFQYAYTASRPPIMLPSPSTYQQVHNHQHYLRSVGQDSNPMAMATIPARYSPVVWNHHGGAVRQAVHEETVDDWKPPYRQYLFEEDTHEAEPEDEFRSVAACASAGLCDNHFDAHDSNGDIDDLNPLNGFGL